MSKTTSLPCVRGLLVLGSLGVLFWSIRGCRRRESV